jgi:hypothetical protein
MKEAMKYALAIAITAAAMFAYMHEAPPEGAVLEVTQEASSQHHPSALPTSTTQNADQPKRELTAAELADIDPASIDWEAMRERYDTNSDPMALRWSFLGEFTDAEIAAFNKLHVVPFNPMIDQTCERSLSGIEGVGDADGVWEVCTPIYLYDEHPYASLSLEELKPLAENDPYAAELAIRIAEDFQSRMDYALQAVALSGKPGPIFEGLQRSSLISLEDNRDPNQILAEVGVKMVFQNLSARLGDPRADTQSLLALLNEYLQSEEDKKDFLTEVQISAQALAEQLAKAQTEKTGQTTIAEAINA